VPELAAIPGISDLWELTDGDPRVRVAIIDGEVDRTHPCFEGAAIEVVPCGWLPEGCDAHMRVDHGTWVAGVLVGQHGSPSPGLAPRCTALVVPGLCDDMTERDPLNSARSIEAAIGAGAHVIVLEQGLPSRSGDVDGLLKSVVRGAEEAGVLVVAPVGNEGTRFQHFPQALPEVLVVGAHGDDGVMFAFSGWGPEYERHGIVAPGENISGPEPGGGLVTHKGTSCSAPIVGGVAALLLSLQVQDGQPPDPLAIRGVLLDTAQRCTLEESRGEPRRCLSGRLDVGAATRHVLHLASTSRPSARVRQDAQVDGRGLTAGVVPAQRADEPAAPDTAGPLVYALGSLGYDFGRPPRRDSFKQLMAPTDLDGTVVPANPHSPRQMVDHLQQHPSEAEALIWTLNIELTPIYAIGPVGAHAPRVYELLVRLLAGELADADDARRIERVGIPGRLSGRSVKLFSGQVVPVIEVEQIRGILGWPVAALAQAALEHVDRRGDDDAASRALREFLTRVYFELRNLGLTASDRALNFAVTNAVAAAQMLAAAVAAGMALDAIAVERSELCRPHSDCWDVTLRFFDPENLRRARRVSRLAVDVSDVVPVTLGPAQSWSESPPPRPALAATSDR
jgi:hypothetical protein